MVMGARLLAALGLAFLVNIGVANPAGDVVLIASANSVITQINSSEMRRLFLGLTIIRGGRVHPLLNVSSAKMKDVFLQSIVAMSASTYDRFLLRQSLQQGREPPIAVGSSRELLDRVAADPLAVSFISQGEVANDKRVKVLRTVWHE